MTTSAAVNRAPCGPGDVLTAWRALSVATHSERREIARLTGFDLVEARESPKFEEPRPLFREPPRAKPDESASTASTGRAPEVLPQRPASGAPLALIPMASQKAEEWPELPAALQDSKQQAPVQPDPLVPQRFLRAWHTRLGRAEREQGQVDVQSLVGLMASGRPIARLPRLRTPTTPRRLIVRIETQAHMAWLHESAQALIAGVARVYGDRVETQWLDDEPPALGREGADGARHILLGTFGARIGSTAADRDRALGWAVFVEAVQRAGGDVVALCPNDLREARAILGPKVALVVWSELASPSQVARAVGALQRP